MTELIEGDFELDGYRLGSTEPIFVEAFDPGVVESRVQDTDNPVGSDRAFGRDRLTGPTWTLDLVVNEYDAAGALAALGALQKAWRADEVRATPGAESALRYAIGGRTRLVYGRSRKLAYSPNGISSGVVQATAEFVTSSPYIYGDEVRSVSVRFVPPTTGGFTAPFTAPIVTAQTGEVQGPIEDVGGEAPAPFRVTFEGPITNPKVTGDGWEMELLASIPYDRTVTIDTRTKTVLRDDGANLSGSLSHKSNLGTARLSPGPDYIVFSGVDKTGTSTCLVEWRPVYVGL